jgi:hypothetical protein
MGTARATLNFVSSMPGPCLAWMTGTRLRIDTRPAHRRPSMASFVARAAAQKFPVDLIPCATPMGSMR